MNKKGIFYYKDGKIKYEGDIVGGKAEGYGKFFFPNGEYYIGQYKDDRMHGKGILYDSDGSIIYEGDYAYGKMDGIGQLNISKVQCYIGEFSKNLFHGKGIIIDNGEIVYDGNFNYGEPID